MHEFDKYASKYINDIANKINKEENRQVGERAKSKRYEYYRRRSRTILVSMKTALKGKRLSEVPDHLFNKYKRLKKEKNV